MCERQPTPQGKLLLLFLISRVGSFTPRQFDWWKKNEEDKANSFFMCVLDP